MGAPDLRRQMAFDGQITGLAQTAGAILDRFAVHLRHPRGGGALAGAVGEDVQPCQRAVLDQFQRVFEMRLGLGREARDDIGPKGHLGAQLARLFREPDRIIAQVTALHPFQDQVVAMLQGQVQMRHQTRLGRNRLHQVFIHLDGVDRRNSKARQIGH